MRTQVKGYANHRSAYEIFGVVTTNESSAVGPAGASEEQGVTVVLEWHDQTAVLAVSGEIDMVTAPQLQNELSRALEKEPATLVVDLTEVGFFASAGLSALVAAYQQAREHTAVRVVAATSATTRPLQVTALDRKIPVYASLEQALTEK